MGTRHLICVFYKGEYKVAQYGQWDGYPAGQGATILDFLKNKVNWQDFRSQLDKLSWITKENLDKLWCPYDGGNSWHSAALFKKNFPEFSRDTGADILRMIQDDELTTNKLENSLTFAADGLFCEWCYVIDIDAGYLEVYQGFNRSPLTPDDRFYFLREYEDDNGYHGVKLKKKYPLDDLPSNEDFIKDCDPPEEEE